MPAYLARTGLAVFAMLFAIALLTEHAAAGRALVAATSTFDLPPLREIVFAPIDAAVFPVTVSDFETTPRRTTAVLNEPAPAVALAVVLPAAPAIGAAPVQADGIVLASWYGPGFYGNRTACGQLYTPEILGVAHLTLPCGTLLTLT